MVAVPPLPKIRGVPNATKLTIAAVTLPNTLRLINHPPYHYLVLSNSICLSLYRNQIWQALRPWFRLFSASPPFYKTRRPAASGNERPLQLCMIFCALLAIGWLDSVKKSVEQICKNL